MDQHREREGHEERAQLQEHAATDRRRRRARASGGAKWARLLLFAAFSAAVASCGRPEPPTPDGPDAPPKPKVITGMALRAGMQPAVFMYISRTRLPDGHGALPGPASAVPVRT